jgi:hypothetical protein
MIAHVEPPTTDGERDSSYTYQTERATAERLRQLEDKYDLFRYRIDGWSAWRLLRFPVALALMNLPLGASARPKTWQRVGRLVTVARFAPQDIPALCFPRRARYVVKTFTSGLSERQGENFKDIYFDDLLTDIGNCFKIEVLNSPVFISRRKAAFIPSDITTCTFELLATTLARSGGPDNITNIAHHFSDCLQQELGLESFGTSHVTRALRHFYWSKRLYARLLKRIRPTYVLVADTDEFAISAAAKEQKIKVIEFQHGVFNRHHPSALPSSAVPYKSHMLVPDRMFLYGQYWKQELEASGFYDQELCPVGSIRMDRYRERRATHRTTQPRGACTLVLTSQGLDTRRLVSFVADFLILAEKQHVDFVLYIKLHPIYETSKALYETPQIASERVHVLLATEAPSTFELLAQADLHLTIASACHYDALGLGVPTVILPLTGHEIALHLVEAGHAHLAHTPQDLLDIVSRWREYTVPTEVSEWYFKPGALENIKRELGLLS